MNVNELRAFAFFVDSIIVRVRRRRNGAVYVFAILLQGGLARSRILADLLFSRRYSQKHFHTNFILNSPTWNRKLFFFASKSRNKFCTYKSYFEYHPVRHCRDWHDVWFHNFYSRLVYWKLGFYFNCFLPTRKA